MEIIKTIAASAVIGAISGIIIAVIGTYLGGGIYLNSGLYGASTGFVIGICASSLFIVFMEKAGKYPVLSIFAVIFVCAAGTSGILLFLGEMQPDIFALIIGLSEIFSIVITLTWYRRYLNLNRKLSETQNRIEKEYAVK